MQKTERNEQGELPPIFDVLNDLVLDQKKELEGLRFPLALVSPSVVFGWYVKTDRFRDVYQEAVKFNLMPHNAEESQMDGDRLVGRMFEDLAYLIMAYREMQNGRAVLSPDRTLLFWERLYPKAKKTNFPHGTGSMERISVPDGIVVEEKDGEIKILSIYEYTLSKDQNVANKRKGLEKVKAAYPSVFNQTSLVFVTPSNGLVTENVLTLPLSTDNFGLFVNYVYRGFRETEEDATLVEIQRRAREQHNKALNFSKNGVLTKEYEAYLEKVTTAPSLI